MTFDLARITKVVKMSRGWLKMDECYVIFNGESANPIADCSDTRGKGSLRFKIESKIKWISRFRPGIRFTGTWRSQA